MRSSWTLLVGVVSTRFQDVITVSKKLWDTVQPVIGLVFFFICHKRCRQRCVVVGSVNDGPWSSGCGWPVVVGLRMARGRLAAPWSSTDDCGSKWSSTCGWPVVICLRMARGHLLADGTCPSACGYPEVVCGWPEVVCGWLEAVCGWPVVVVENRLGSVVAFIKIDRRHPCRGAEADPYRPDCSDGDRNSTVANLCASKVSQMECGHSGDFPLFVGVTEFSGGGQVA